MERLIETWNCLDEVWQTFIILPLCLVLIVIVLWVHGRLMQLSAYRACGKACGGPFIFIGDKIDICANWVGFKFPKTCNVTQWTLAIIAMVGLAACVILFLIAAYQSVVCYLDVG